MEDTFCCEICGRELPAAEETVWSGQHLCRSCLAEDTVVCRECGERIRREDNAGNEENPLC